MKTKFRTILKISLFSIAAIALLIFIIAMNEYLKDEKLLFYATGTQYKAFLNSTWEMSEKEIERANDTYLSLSEFSFFSFDPRYPKVLRMSRYKERIQNNITVFGYNSKVRYSFFDNKLFEYTLILEGFDAAKLHKQIYSNISKKFGKGRVQEKKAYQIRSISWENTDLTVDYWLVKQSSSNNSTTFTAGVRFSYKPIFNKIKQIRLSEEKSLF